MQADITTICKPRWVAEVMTVTLTGDKPAELRLTFAVDPAARAARPGRSSVDGGIDEFPLFSCFALSFPFNLACDLLPVTGSDNGAAIA